MICVTQASVSTLLTMVGLRNAPSMAGNGGLIRGHARLPSSDLDQARFLAADVRPGPAVQHDVEVEARAEDVLAEQLGCVELVDRRLRASGRRRRTRSGRRSKAVCDLIA